MNSSNLTNINRDTRIFGILGFPLSHSLSPVIHNTWFSEYGVNAVYLVFEKEFPEKTAFFRDKAFLKISGLSVTIPHKEWAFEISEECDETSKTIQASNTLVPNEEGIIHSYNTDSAGALSALQRGKKKILESKKDALILGSGGSARGISYALLKNGYAGNIVISSRNEEKAREIIGHLNQIRPASSDYIPFTQLENEKKRFSLIVNTTPVGMKGRTDAELLDSGFYLKNHTVFDIVYNPIRTQMVINAEKAGAKTVSGLDMLIFQAAEQFRLFTGISVQQKSISSIRKVLESKLKD